MKKKNEEVHTKWMNDPEYRKQVLRELEQKLGMNIPTREFSQLVYAEKF